MYNLFVGLIENTCTWLVEYKLHNQVPDNTGELPLLTEKHVQRRQRLCGWDSRWWNKNFLNLARMSRPWSSAKAQKPLSCCNHVLWVKVNLFLDMPIVVLVLSFWLKRVQTTIIKGQWFLNLQTKPSLLLTGLAWFDRRFKNHWLGAIQQDKCSDYRQRITTIIWLRGLSHVQHVLAIHLHIKLRPLCWILSCELLPGEAIPSSQILAVASYQAREWP